MLSMLSWPFRSSKSPAQSSRPVPAKPPEGVLLTRQEACDFLRVSISTLRRMRVPFVRIQGRGVRYEQAELDKFVAGARTKPARKTATAESAAEIGARVARDAIRAVAGSKQ
jgi:excisionase family DNA binding protein